MESMIAQDAEVQRQRRGSPTQDKEEEKKREKGRQQVMKMTGLAANAIDQWLKWANSDPTSKILPHSTVRIL